MSIKTSKILSVAATLLICAAMTAAPAKKKKNDIQPRGQWTEQQAWEWEQKVGVIKGMNCPQAGYPGMSLDYMMEKISELGLNSVRFWYGGNTVEEQIKNIRLYADTAEKYGMTISPVLSIQRSPRFFFNPDAEQGMKDLEEFIKAVITPFKDDPRIVLWDIWNEPCYRDGFDTEGTLKEMDWIEQMVYWCREVGLSQPISSSIIWDTGLNEEVTSDVYKRRCEVEAMMDVHNFHDYTCGDNFGADGQFTIDKIRKIGNRPLIATECLTRTNGSGLGRTFALFEKNHVHFYLWGSFISDANWSAKWSRSTYDPYEPIFHNTMWADGDIYDYRDIELIRNFQFTDASRDPGLEYTERWSHDRVWTRMVTGPIKGSFKLKNESTGFNSIRVKLDYAYYKGHVIDFFKFIDEHINEANFKHNSILIQMLDDTYADVPAEDLAKFVSDVIGKYYDNPTIVAWELWHNPGEKCKDTKKLSDLITLVFRNARNQYPNQPLTATPYVKVKEFAPDFDYHSALIHGRRNGWNMIEYPGASDVELVHKIWSLSDVISFATEQPQAEAGWLLSICYRYGRPIFCTDLKCTSEEERVKTLERFAMSHVYWYCGESLPENAAKDFRFIPIQTQH